MGYEELIIDLKNEKIVREDKKGLHFEQSYYDIYKTIISGFFKRTISDLSDPEKTHQLLYDKVSMKKANTVLRNGFPEEFKVFGLVNKFDSMEEVRFLTEFLIWICSKDGQAKLYIMSGLTASEQSKNILPDFHTVLIHWMDEEEEFQNILGTEVTVSDNLRLFLAYEALFISP